MQRVSLSPQYLLKNQNYMMNILMPWEIKLSCILSLCLPATESVCCISVHWYEYVKVNILSSADAVNWVRDSVGYFNDINTIVD